MQAVAADHPLGPDADVLREQPLQPPHAQPQLAGEAFGPGHGLVLGDQLDRGRRLAHPGVIVRPVLQQERLHGRHVERRGQVRAEHLHGTMSAGLEQGREMGLYGPQVAVPADAPALDHILGLTGRDPAWS